MGAFERLRTIEDGPSNPLEDRAEVFLNFTVPESQHRAPHGGKLFGTLGVLLLAGWMGRSVRLDDETKRNAHEVAHVAAENMLPAELNPFHSAVTDRGPKDSLGLGRIAAHFSRNAAADDRVSRQAPAPHPALPRDAGEGRARQCRISAASGHGSQGAASRFSTLRAAPVIAPSTPET